MSSSIETNQMQFSDSDLSFLASNLEIILVSYNCFSRLEDLVSMLLNENSPVKNCSITILDNGSTDVQYKNLENTFAKHNNISYSRNKYHVANDNCVTRIFELAEKKYFWALTDDMYELNWSNWANIQQALVSDDYDIINLGRISTLLDRIDASSNQKLSTTMKQLCYLSSGIYRNSCINSEVIHNAYFLTVYLFPILSLICSVINNGGKIFNVENSESVVEYKDSYFLSLNELNQDIVNTDEILDKRSQMIAETAWATCTSLLHDDELRQTCMQALCFKNENTFAGTIRNKLVNNVNLGLWENLTTIYHLSNEEQKDKFYIMLKEYIDGYKAHATEQKDNIDINFKATIKREIKRKILNFLRIKY